MNTDDALVGSLDGYADFLADIKSRIQTAQVKAALSLSREVVWLYWQIGHEVLARQARHGWGAKIADRLAADLKAAFPGIEGFSPRNIKYMRAFAEANPDLEIVQQLLHNSPLPWGHHLRILDKAKNADQRLWYIQAAHTHGWSRSILEMQIESRLHERQGKAQALLKKPCALAHGFDYGFASCRNIQKLHERLDSAVFLCDNTSTLIEMLL